MRVPRWVVVSLAGGGVAIAVWLVNSRTRPAFAVYDSPPAAAPIPVVVQPPRDSALPAAPATSATAAPGRKPHAPARVSAPAAADSDTVAARPHRSDNYGGYSGYGSRERRRPPSGK